MSSGPGNSFTNALRLKIAGGSSEASNPSRNVNLHCDFSPSPISATPFADDTTSRQAARDARLTRLSYSSEVVLPDSIPFPTCPSKLDFSRNPTAFTPLDLRTTINNIVSRTIRETAVRDLMLKLPGLEIQGPLNPLLRCADELLRIDGEMLNVLASLSVEELVEMHGIHRIVKKELKPWLRECQIPKPWSRNAVSIQACDHLQRLMSVPY